MFALALVASAWAALRPDPRLERLGAWLFAPARLLAECCAPLRMARLRSARAAEEALIARDGDEHAARVELQRRQRQAAEPLAPELRAGRRFVHGEVIDRAAQRFDSLIVRLDGSDARGLAPGMAVVHGEDYVGRVSQVDAPHRAHVVVELVTARDFAVGARLEALDEQELPLRGVVGGLAAHSHLGRELRLGLAVPSRRALPAVVARVDESLSPLAPFAGESAGFRLGRVEESPRGEAVIAPQLDLRSGPFRVAIVAPEHIDRPTGLAPYEPLADAHWVAARVLARSVGRREGVLLSAGTLDAIESGAAFVVGSRLVGRVADVALTHCSVATLADVGWPLPVVALPRGSATPVPLGFLIARGRAPGKLGELEFEWRSDGLPLAGAEALEVELFSGSGAPGVPSGLWIGRTRLPLGSGVHRLAVDTQVELRDLRRGFVRTREVFP